MQMNYWLSDKHTGPVIMEQRDRCVKVCFFFFFFLLQHGSISRWNEQKQYRSKCWDPDRVTVSEASASAGRKLQTPSLHRPHLRWNSPAVILLWLGFTLIRIISITRVRFKQPALKILYTPFASKDKILQSAESDVRQFDKSVRSGCPICF